MSGKTEAVVYVTWDETGQYAAHTEAEEAADLLDEKSSGRFRRVVAVRLSLPPAGPSEISLDLPEDGERPTVRRG